MFPVFSGGHLVTFSPRRSRRILYSHAKVCCARHRSGLFRQECFLFVPENSGGPICTLSLLVRSLSLRTHQRKAKVHFSSVLPASIVAGNHKKSLFSPFSSPPSLAPSSPLLAL